MAGVLAILLASGSEAVAQAVPHGFQETLVTGGLARPMSLDFLPDGRVIVAEQQVHRLRVVVASGVAAVVGVIPDVAPGTEGLLGVAVDPRWPEEPYIYVGAGILLAFFSRLFAGNPRTPAPGHLERWRSSPLALS